MSESGEPIACNLDSEALTERVDEWRALVASSVRTIAADATSVRLELDGSDAALLRASALGQREKACCPFFEVTVDLAAETRTLSLRVPEGAEAVLTNFVELLRS